MNNDYMTMVMKYYAEQERANRLEKTLKEILDNKEFNRVEHMFYLEEKNKKLKEQVRQMQVQAEHHNKMAYATGLIVNCTGCAAGKPFDGENLTEEKVRMVEGIAYRLRTWWSGHQARLNRK